jgi:hypothetical protein
MTAEVTLAQWSQQLEAVHSNMLSVGGKPGFSAPSTVADKSGLDLLQAWLAGELPYPPMCDTLDSPLVEVEVGRVVFQGTP